VEGLASCNYFYCNRDSRRFYYIYINNKLELDKRRYELKKNTYFELLDTFLKLQRISIDTQTLRLKRAAKPPDLDATVELPEEMELNKAFYEAYGKLRLLRAKVQILNNSEKVEAIIGDYLDKWVQEAPLEIDEMMKNLIEALKEEL
jgi:hypothetical protein